MAELKILYYLNYLILLNYKFIILFLYFYFALLLVRTYQGDSHRSSNDSPAQSTAFNFSGDILRGIKSFSL